MNSSSYIHLLKFLRDRLFLLSFLLLSSLAPAQTPSISLEECYQLTRQHFPLYKQQALIEKSNAYSLRNLSTENFPQFNIQGQANYQSDVTQIPLQLPGISIPVLNKDQYKVYGEISQTVLDGGILKKKKEKQKNQSKIETQQLEVELYALKKSINRLYFGILLLEQQLQQNSLMQEDIEQGIQKVQTAIRNGTALKSSAVILKAEKLKVQQNELEMQADRTSYLSMLSLFIQRNLDESTTFIVPDAPMFTGIIKRPELLLFAFQKQSLQTQQELLHAKNRPKLNIFAQGGMGRPALNMLSNDVDGYYVLGLRMTVPLNGFYTFRNDETLILVKQQGIDVQKEVFLFNTQLDITQQHAEIRKYKKLLASDNLLIDLRTTIKNAALVQLENGIITSHDYLRETIAENQARQQKVLHETQLLMKSYELKTTEGIDN